MPRRSDIVPSRRQIGQVVRRLAEQNELVGRTASRFVRFIETNPDNSYLKKRIQAFRVPFQPVMNFRDVLEVAEALQEAGVKFWLAGGWGIDVLVGIQSRDHQDLDIVLEDVVQGEPLVSRALSQLGYVRSERKGGGVWMPSVIVLSDVSGRRIELMEINWERFAVNSAPLAGQDTKLEIMALSDVAFDEGVIFDQRLPCLSRTAQLLFHSDFTLAPRQRQDVDRLKESLG